MRLRFAVVLVTRLPVGIIGGRNQIARAIVEDRPQESCIDRLTFDNSNFALDQNNCEF